MNYRLGNYNNNFLNQEKLTKKEWENIEIITNNINEQEILKMISDGYNNNDIKINKYKCLYQYLNIQKKYFEIIFFELLFPIIKKINKKNIFDIDFILSKYNNKNKNKIPNADKIKIKNSLNNIDDIKLSNIIDFSIIEEIKKISKIILTNEYIYDKKFILCIININFLYENYKNNINEILLEIIEYILEKYTKEINIEFMLKNYTKLIQHNKIFNYKPLVLYDHQKEIFKIFKEKKNVPKLIYYCTPTCSGKTLTPLGLTNEYKVIFVCASKHIGLNLAKCGYFLKNKIGFAFGCNTTDDIRLNYNAINSYINTPYRKIPNHQDGTNVQLMISDLMSYKYAMDYMSKFHPINSIVLFWDEPTIGMDVENSPLHEIIKDNWTNNIIPNVVLSCATLPKIEKINNVIKNQTKKFNNLHFEHIETNEIFSNISIYNENGEIIMPHNYFDNYKDMSSFINHHNKKYYNFFDCDECCKFILYVNKKCNLNIINDNFKHFTEVKIEKIKKLYINTLLSLKDDKWEIIEKYNKNNINNNYLDVNITTENAKSLTNGPTLFISNNIENICKYLLMKSKIDKNILKSIQNKIMSNNKISEILLQKTKDYEDKIEKYKDNDKIMTEMRFPPDVLELNAEINKLQNSIKSLSIDSVYLPNTRTHYNKWKTYDDLDFDKSDVFCSNIDDENIKEIMQLYTTPMLYKIMLLLGIGVFSNNISDITDCNKEDINVENNKYVEIIKKLAEQKSLYLILADSDYIYGTNYQFSHCYLSKDMKNLSQEKIIQCIGRVGRQEKNKHFSFRFRSKDHINIFYSMAENSIEADNMNKLFI